MHTIKLLLLCLLPSFVYGGSFSALEKLNKQGAKISALAVLLSDKKPIVGQLNPQHSLSPASISKLYVAAWALDTFSPYYRFQTRLSSTSEVNERGDLAGDLVFYGSGDPTLDSSGLWQLAIDLKAKNGVKRIKGNLVVNQSRFGTIECDGIDRCAARQVSRNAYDAPLSSAGVNYASWCLTVEPGEELTDPAKVRDCDLDINGVTIENEVKTVALGKPRQVNVIRKTKSGVETIRLSGQIPLEHKPYKVYRSTSNAPLQTARILRRMLQELGIRITGKIKVVNLPIAKESVTLAAYDGMQLNHQLNNMLLWSSNYMADLFTLNIASRKLKKRPTLVDASLALSGFAKKINESLPKHIRVMTGSPKLLNGSGLNPDSRFSAADMIGLLNYVYHKHEIFPAFVGGMTIPEFSYSRRLRSGPANWRPNLMVKTGTLSYPVTVSTLAGYFRCKNGEWGAFATMVNGTPSNPSVRYRDINNALYEDLTGIMESCK